eukprot:SAG11_NODE_56_length_19295_cov_20.219675_23_plen_87_part_00
MSTNYSASAAACDVSAPAACAGDSMHAPSVGIPRSTYWVIRNYIKSEFYCGLESKHTIQLWIALELQIPKLVAKVSGLQYRCFVLP